MLIYGEKYMRKNKKNYLFDENEIEIDFVENKKIVKKLIEKALHGVWLRVLSVISIINILIYLTTLHEKIIYIFFKQKLLLLLLPFFLLLLLSYLKT